jgi:hypothetical protein
MSDPRMDDALEQCGRIRELILHHSGGWADKVALDQFSIYCRAASRAAEDPDCRELMDAAYRYALDLFSATAHEKWAVGGTSGADVLRLKILGMLNAFRGNLARYHLLGW